ncbi:MAG: DUF4373 domain-containing protein [Gammaproteobacteria bacterium]|nr:DUF4373 domain-containing protein [Gammaproteobacteria bacterium]
MKWFKHDSNAHTDAKLKKLKHKHGIVGYGLYWYCVELIAESVDKNNITFELEEDAELIALEWNLDQIRVQEIMIDMSNLGLFENDNGQITCLKLAKRLDDTNAKNPQIRQILSKLNGDTPNNSEQLGDTPNNSGQTRLDKNRKEPTSENKFSEDDLRLSQFIFSRIKILSPKAKNPNFEKWADTIRLLREVDKRDHKEIQDIFIWANENSFWQGNILSPTSLREKFDQLEIKKNSESSEDDQPMVIDYV